MDAGVALGGWATAIAVALHARLAIGRQLEHAARASHELRGPLTAARLGIELGTRRGELSAARLQAVQLELARAALALDDLAGVRREATLTAANGDVDLRELVKHSLEAARATAQASDAELELRWAAGACMIRGDRLRLAQAVGNLLANAIEHGSGRVEVRARCEGDLVRLEVVDGGPGLGAPIAELMRGARAGRGRRGRGLAIAADVAREHGGRLAAAPSRRGARLVLELPVKAHAQRAAPPA